MNAAQSKRVEDFLDKWLGSEGNERANYQTFFGDLCVALDVPEPPPKGSVEGDRYCFDKNIKFYSEKAETTRFADFYKEGHFLIEAKQGSTNLAKLSRWLEDNARSGESMVGLRLKPPRASISIDGGIDGESSPVSAHEVANFLMRCIFTMFAEDVELLKGEVFTKALRERWIPNPKLFKPEIEQLWQTIDLLRKSEIDRQNLYLSVYSTNLLLLVNNP